MNPSNDPDQLIAHLEAQFKAPQKSERWAMYRVITPVVDFACKSTNLVSEFEFNQQSHYGTHQSVDIALCNEGAPEVLVEAKRIGRTISAQQIAKYMETTPRGIVSNGADWIICTSKDQSLVRLWDTVENRVHTASLKQICNFITQGTLSGEKLSVGQDIKPRIKAPKPASPRASSNQTQVVQTIDSKQHLKQCTSKNAKLSLADKAFLSTFADKLSDKPRIEYRERRLTVTDMTTGRRKRLMRIEFGKTQPSVLLKTELVDDPAFSQHNLTHTRHDKHAGMREFRPQSTEEAQVLADVIGQILFKN